MAILVVVSHTKCRPAAIIKPNLCVKFAKEFSISSKIAASYKYLGGLTNFSLTWETGSLGHRAGKNFYY